MQNQKSNKSDKDSEKKGSGNSSSLVRIESGIPRLDSVLHGGFFKGGMYSIVGPAGSGKTMMANQFCFHHIKKNQSTCVYFTLLAESHGKLIKHLSTLSFFDIDVVPKNITYISGYSVLRKEGLRGLAELIKRTLKENNTDIFILDGLQAINKKKSSGIRVFDEFIYEIQAFTNILGCTSLLLMPIGAYHTIDTENVIVDGVLELGSSFFGPRSVRELTVHKLRGTGFLPGKHEVELNEHGLEVHPRTEIQFAKYSVSEQERIKMLFGIPELDEMLFGGIMSETTTSLIGSPGTGKTILGLSFLIEGARKGQKGIYFGFHETPTRLMGKVQSVGLPLKEFVEKGLIEIIWQPLMEASLDAIAEKILEKIRAEGSQRRRLFIDGAEGFRSATIYSDRLARFMNVFTNQLRILGVTCIISEELDVFMPELKMNDNEIVLASEGVILLKYKDGSDQSQREIKILSMREIPYQAGSRTFYITSDGFVMGDSKKIPKPKSGNREENEKNTYS